MCFENNSCMWLILIMLLVCCCGMGCSQGCGGHCCTSHNGCGEDCCCC